MTTRIYTADIDAYDPSAPGVVTLRYATQGYVTKSTDTPASTYYDGRIQQPANMQRSAFDGGATYGATRVGFGELVLINNDGELDDLITYGFDGRSITIKMGTIGPGDAGVPTWTTILVGTMEQAEIGWRTVAIRIRDRQAELDIPLQATKYGGTNSLPAGLDGVAGDIEGTPKPWGHGVVYNIAPPCVNTSRLIFQVHDGAIKTVDAAYDRGATLTKGADYTDQTDMETNAPAASNFRVWPAGGYFRMGSSPVGQITCDATIGTNASDRTAAQAMKAVMLKAGIASGDISSADVTALDTANAGEVGIWCGTETRAVDALDLLANSVGAYWGVDRLGVFRMARISTPSGTPVATLTPLELISVERQAAGEGIPAYSVSLGYARYWTVQESDLAGAVTAARREELRVEYRRVTSVDATVQTTYLLAPELTFDTLLVSASAAQTEADRLLALYKVRRDLLEVRVAIDATLAAALDIGAVVSVEIPRFGMDAGKLFLVVGIRPDLKAGVVDLTLWG